MLIIKCSLLLVLVLQLTYSYNLLTYSYDTYYKAFPLQLTYSYDTYYCYKAFPLHLPNISYSAIFKQKGNSNLQNITLFISWETFHLWCHLFGQTQSHKSDININEHQPVTPPLHPWISWHCVPNK